MVVAPDNSSWSRGIESRVLPHIMPGVLFFTLVATVVCVVCDRLHLDLKVNTVMLSIIGLIISFAISLRTTSATGRYDEGRKAWSSLGFACRQIAIAVWIYLPHTTQSKEAVKELSREQLEIEKAKGLLEKRTVLRLLLGFAVATKHHLRNENGIYYEDLYPLCACLPKHCFSGPEDATDSTAILNRAYSTSKSPESEHSSTRDATHHTVVLKPARMPPNKTVYDRFPPLRLFQYLYNMFFGKKDSVEEDITEPDVHVPLEISLFLSAYMQSIVYRGTFAGQPGYIISPLGLLQDSITTLERVLTTPLPFAYQAHLRMSVYIYLLFLPFQTYGLLGYLSIVASCISSTIYLGFMELGSQLENPFGYDGTDLPLDTFCENIRLELEQIMRRPIPDATNYLFSPDNFPISSDPRNAQQIFEEAIRQWKVDGSGATPTAKINEAFLRNHGARSKGGFSREYPTEVVLDMSVKLE